MKYELEKALLSAVHHYLSPEIPHAWNQRYLETVILYSDVTCDGD